MAGRGAKRFDHDRFQPMTDERRRRAADAECLRNVRSGDYDRYLCAVLAPPMVRPALMALYAINLEVHRTLIERCRPGARVHELWELTMGEYRKAGWPGHHMLIGHSVGAALNHRVLY